jgi:hypothetical protein
MSGQWWDIWSEGYRATCEHGTARLQAHRWAETFEQACDEWADSVGHDKIGGYTPATDGRPPRAWACRLFPTEAEARRSCG